MWLVSIYEWTLTLSSPAMNAKYTPGNQQCRSTLQFRTSCVGVLHVRSLPTYFRLLYVLYHSSSLIHLYTSLKTVPCHIKWVWLFEVWFWCNTVSGMHMFSIWIIWQKVAVSTTALEKVIDYRLRKHWLFHCRCQQQVHSVTDCPWPCSLLALSCNKELHARNSPLMKC